MELQRVCTPGTESCPSLSNSSTITELASAPLEPYVRQALGAFVYTGARKASSTLKSLFRSSPEPPMLNAGTVNRVLVFSGCFNPPHRAHLQMLDFVFRHVGADLNVVAAFIKFADEKTCVEKDERRGMMPFALSTRQRVCLWKGDPEARKCLSWAWPCPLEERRYTHFAQRLKTVAAEDGFELDFIWLVGGDHVSATRMPRYDVPEIVVTDFGRPVDFFGDSASRLDLDVIPGFARWDHLSVPRCKSISGASSSSSHGVEDATSQAGSIPSQLVFECKRILENKWKTQSIRFVPGYATDLNIAHPRLNSSSIRRVITGLPMDELTEVLRPHVLNLSRLMLYVRNKRMPANAKNAPPRDLEDSDVDIRTIIS